MNTFSKFQIVVSLVLTASILAGGTGCGIKSASWKPSEIFSLDNAWPFEDDDEPEEGVPVRLVGAWTDTVLTKAGQKPQRGFGGRLMFYGEKDEKPILVDGQLVVYAFDETGRQPTDNKPTRRYVFPADQMRLRMSKSDVGASYSFWLPWDEVGGPKTEVSLVCRFEPKGGPVITGEQTRHLLPGTMPAEAAVTSGSSPKLPEGEPMRPARLRLESVQSQQQVHGGAQHASYESPVDPQAAAAASMTNAAPAPARQMSVTSIVLPENFQLPNGSAYAPAGAAAVGQTHKPRPFVQQTLPAQYQQPAAVQPINQTMQAPVMNGTSTMQQMQQMPAAQYQMGAGATTQHPNASMQNTLVAPMGRPQLLGQQPVVGQVVQPIGSPAGTTVVGQAAQMGTLTQQQVTPQTIPQQGWQQFPTANGVRTAVSYPTPGAVPVR
ncbi:MAG: hypothetical protein L0228_05705 [Planctomycetes bacterium]|nr:hypothetical protein [Planctomycetota bacterium]